MRPPELEPAWRVPRAADSPEIGMGVSSTEDCVSYWKMEVLGHAPCHCSRPKPANASCVWVLAVGDSVTSVDLLII
jgi:hypothetical protein